MRESPSVDALPSTHGLPTEYTVGPAGSAHAVRVAPNVVLAPMEGVTDLAFRRMLRDAARATDSVGPGLVYSEFIASKGIARSDRRVWEVASFDPDEQPIALQIYGREPALMAEAARLLEAHGAAIIDINMGCPAKKVVCHSGGSSLMREPSAALEIVRAVRKAIQIPLTVKMRTGFDARSKNAPDLAQAFESEGVDALTVHWRTREDGYGGVRAVEAIAESVSRVRIPVLGNGDVIDVQTASAMMRETGCHGVMIGRGAIRNPWVFAEIADWLAGRPLTAPTLAQQRHAITRYLHHADALYGSPERSLGKLKQLVKLFADVLPGGDVLRVAVLRSPTRAAADEQLSRWFDAEAERSRAPQF
jgi:tRNA-dihydrouridine synthase B